jgi:hypothetical protein
MHENRSKAAVTPLILDSPQRLVHKFYRFNAIQYSKETSTDVVGAGLFWNDVYEALESYDVNVIGGHVSGVGVARFTLGGGLS